MKTIYLLFISIVSLVLVNSCKNESASLNPDATVKEIVKEMEKSKTFIIKYKMVVNYEDTKNVSTSTEWIDLVNDRLAIETESEVNMMGEKRKNKDLKEMKSKMWYYQGIPLKMANAYYNMEAVEIQENVDIPAEKFEVPAGIKIKDMPGMK
ncbi:MAG: hypothetical protein IPH57_02615 [Saprospiraceae bacterium]|nr:hypothetical protein [Saprospiraceae bacterium]